MLDYYIFVKYSHFVQIQIQIMPADFGGVTWGQGVVEGTYPSIYAPEGARA